MRTQMMALILPAIVWSACGTAHDGALQFDLALTSPAPDAGERAKHRIAIVAQREALALGDVSVTASEGHLRVIAKVAGGPDCVAFERARELLRKALLVAPRLAFHASLAADPGTMLQAVRDALGAEVEVKPADWGPVAIVMPRAGVDIPAKVRALSDPTRLLVAELVDGHTQRPRFFVWTLDPTVALSHREIRSAKSEAGSPDGPPVVAVTLSEDGGKRLASLTERLVGRHIAILVDDVPVSVPLVKEAVTSGRFHMSLDSIADARELATALDTPPIAERVVLEADSSRCSAIDTPDTSR